MNKELPELRDIPEFSGLYAATADGRIYSYRAKKFMKICNGNKGYQQVCLQIEHKPYMRYVHRLVAMAWIPNPDNLPEVNHKDENKSNNNVSNLEWCTRQYNLKASSVGFKPTPVYCVELDKEFESLSAAARFVGVTSGSINDCLRGRAKTIRGYRWKYAKEKGE